MAAPQESLRDKKVKAFSKSTNAKAIRRSRKSHRLAKGSRFENLVRNLLEQAQSQSKRRLTYKAKPPIKLQNGEVLIPDFSIRIKKPHEVRHFLIECQNRKRFKKEILYKIQHIRAKHRSKTFFFVHAGKAGPELERTLKVEGVASLDLQQFGNYIHDEAILTEQSWSISRSGYSVPLSVSIERHTLLSKTMVALHSHPDARLQTDDLPEKEEPITNSESGDDKAGAALG